jgi:Mg-chelatase subunit ChlD
MAAPNKLPLLVSACKLLTAQLGARDRVSLVTYAGNAGVVLEPTPGDQRAKILAALEQLGAGGPPMAPLASRAPIAWPSRRACRQGSTASSWLPTATSTSAWSTTKP